MNEIITQPEEQVYETYSPLLGISKAIYLFNALGMLDYRCYPDNWTFERSGPDGMIALIFWRDYRYASYDTSFVFERYVVLDERWLFGLAKDPEDRKSTVTWQTYNRGGVLYERYDEMFISLLPRKVENPKLKRVLLSRTDPAKLSFTEMVDFLQLKRFGGCVDGEDERQAFILDLSFNPEITDELMVIYFDLNKEIFCITHES